jgi:hypothetical protein
MNTHPQSNVWNLVLFMDVFEIKECELTMPKNNFAGAFILRELLNSKLEAAGQLLEPMILAGSLNHNVACGAVRDVFESDRIVRAVLEKIDFLPFARIYRFDSSELIYRSLFPANGEDIQFKQLENQFAAIKAAAMPAIARAQEFIRSQKNK